jgi:Icc-related predicted phosphoesterase
VSNTCFFVSDLHGRSTRYRALWSRAIAERPQALFLGGDLVPSGWAATVPGASDFIREDLASGFRELRDALGSAYPRVFIILGNDDPRSEEEALQEGEGEGLWTYVHARSAELAGRRVYGYACVPPTPFLMKDWERYDVGRHVPPGSVSPEEGFRSVPEEDHRIRWATIRNDLEELVGSDPVGDAVFLIHSPPHGTLLDRVAEDGKAVEHVPLDLHVGSVAVRRFIEERQPLLTLHGHIHESARLTGSWRDRLGRTHLFSAAHDGPELALVRFRLDDLGSASRELV